MVNIKIRTTQSFESHYLNWVIQMPDVSDTKKRDTPGNATEKKGDERTSKRRQIGGNIPYTTSIGVFERVLDNMIKAERPDVFSRDFMATVLEASGGATNPIIPILKKSELLDQGGKPTELYEKFQSDSGRSAASLAAMRNAFEDIFQRNKYAHKADSEKVKDIIRSVTGLPKSDAIITYMYNTFHAFQKYVEKAADTQNGENELSENISMNIAPEAAASRSLGLSYNINIVLPNNASLETYNKIFRSIKENLLNE